jgi:N-acyl-D-aspartate/D-glutamate deacylase
MPPLDLLITGGQVVDGTGSPAFEGNVGIQGDRIVWIGLGPLPQRPQARKVIEAKGLTVTPGFIDSHSHSDVMVLRDPDYDAKIRQGVTTDVIGICGFSLAPVSLSTLPLFDQYLSAIAAGHPVGYDWETFQDYLAVVRKSPLPVNVVPLVGHGTIRMAVMGFDRRPPAADELRRMVDWVREGVNAGARGLSSGLVYPPGAYAAQEELIALLEPVAQAGGIYSTHIRNESHRVEEAVAEAIAIGRKAGVPLVISHLKAMGPRNWNKVDGILRQVDEARQAGQEVVFDQYPYTACSTLLNALVPPWAHEGGIPELLKKLENKAARAEILRAVENLDDGSWENFVLDADGWSGIIACTVPWGESHEGRSFAEIAAATGKSPGDLLADLLIDLEGGGTVVAHTMSEENVVKIMTHSAHIVGSDSNPCEGKPHPRLYGTFTRVLCHYARDRGVLSLEEAVARMTGKTARFYGLHDRGILSQGKRADLVVFDYAGLKENATFADPRRHPEGVKAVILNGQVVVEEDKRALGWAAGRVLTRGET